MSPIFTSPDDTLFREREVLEFDYTPEIFDFRESQLKELVYCLRPGLRGSQPVNAILRGIPGTGKTTSIRKIFSEIEGITGRMLPVYINCQSEKTLFAILARIHHRLHGYSPPALGNPERIVLEKVSRALGEKNKVLVVCFDDANYILSGKVLNSALRTLLRLHEVFPGIKVGIILAVSNLEVNFSQELDSGVMSVFNPTEISYPPYTWEEVQSILRERVSRALFPGVLSDDLLDLIVDWTVSCGDLRVGIDLIRRAAMRAESERQKEITRDHLEKAFESSRDVHLENCIRVLSKNERELLVHIAGLILDEPGSPLTTGILYDSLTLKTHMSYTLFYQRIRKLDEMRLITIKNKNLGRRGKTREVVLRYDPARVMKLSGEESRKNP